MSDSDSRAAGRLRKVYSSLEEGAGSSAHQFITESLLALLCVRKRAETAMLGGHSPGSQDGDPYLESLSPVSATLLSRTGIGTNNSQPLSVAKAGMEANMAELEEQLLNALQGLESASAEKPCGCQEKAGFESASDIFGFDQASGSGDLAADLESALNQVSSGVGSDIELLGDLSVEEELAFLEFAALEEGPTLELNDIIAAAERYPGLKISFSF